MQKSYFISILLSCLSAATLISCSNNKVKPTEIKSFSMSNKMLESTQVAITRSQNIKNELTFFGKITADNNKLVEVYPVVGGNVLKVYVGIGDYVSKGQILASIRSSEVAEFEKDLEDAKSDLAVAKNNYKAAKELFEGKLNTERDVLAAKSNLDKALFQLQRVETNFKIYNIKPGAIIEVHAPISGFIIQKNINQDMLLRNDKSDNIFDIAQINEVWAMANVSESEISQVKQGINAEVTTLSYPDKKYYGTVDKIYNIIDPESKAMKARVKLDNSDFQLKPDMRATIKMYYTEDKKMIAIPSSALVFSRSKNYVMVFKDRNNIETRLVNVYRQVGDTSYINEGLKEGEKVMTTNQLLIYNALND